MVKDKKKEKNTFKEIGIQVSATIISTVILTVMGMNEADKIVNAVNNISFQGENSGNGINNGDGDITINNYYGVITESSVFNVSVEMDSDSIITSEVKMQQSTIIGLNAETGENVFADDLVNSVAIFPYEQDGYNIYFMGGFNDEYKWDGLCYLNAYKDGLLQYSIEAQYEDGKERSVNQIHRNGSVWIYSSYTNLSENRTVRHYVKQSDLPIMFEETNVDENDILAPEYVLNNCCGRLSLYYVGEVENDLFNDLSGNAYMIIYGDDGKIDYYYKGLLKAGKPEDNIGESWSIKWDYCEPQGYMYYKGKFVDGKRANGEKPQLTLLTIDQLNEFVGDDILGEWRVVQDNYL